MKRTLAAVMAALLVAQVATVPVAAADGPDVQQYSVNGQLQPSFLVELNDNSISSLEDWANASDTREIQTTYGDGTYAVVAGPRDAITGTRLILGVEVPTVTGTPLADRSYVKDVHLNTKMDVPKTPGFSSESNFETPTIGRLAFNDPEFATDGLAFSDDVNKTDLQTARQATGDDNLTSEGAGTTIAVIDTGANTADGRVFGNGSANSSIRILDASRNFVADGSPTVANNSLETIADGNGHGTWTAAAAAANTSYDAYDGMAPDANLLILKALADDGSGSMADISQAIRYAADENADVISMSLGSMKRTPAVEDAIDYAHEQGSVVVVAAGNSRQTRGTQLASPADYAPAITVGATTSGDGTSNVSSADFSQIGPEPTVGDLGGTANVGTEVDVGAPGYKITARVVTDSGSPANETLSGTSMATPLVAGGIAAAMSSNTTLDTADPSTVHDAVGDSARPASRAAKVEVGNGVFASDNLADGTTYSTSQEEAMTDAAQQRDTFYRSMSDSKARSLLDGLLGGGLISDALSA